MSSEQKMSWSQKLKSTFKGKSKTSDPAKTKQTSEASTADSAEEVVTQVTVTAQETMETAKSTQEGLANANAAQTTAGTVEEDAQKATDTADLETQAKAMGITFSDEGVEAAAQPVEAPSSYSSWMDQMRDGFQQGFNSMSEKTKQGYEAAATMINSPEAQSWTQSMKDGFHQGVSTVSEKTSQSYAVARAYMAGGAESSNTDTEVVPSWTERVQSNFTMCLSTGYEATMELVVGKSDQPLASSQVDATSAHAAGEHACTQVSAAAKTAGKEMEKVWETSKGMMQEGADRAATALKPKSAKVGGA